MKKNENITNNFEAESSFLDDLKKENNFSTPPNYFESLPKIINSKKDHYNTNPLRNIKLFPKVSVSIISLTLLIFIIINWSDNTLPKQLTPNQISEILIDENYIDFDEDLLFETYAEILTPEIDEQSDSEEMINYLIDNDIDINYIIEEL